ncbi:MAG: PQQ-binding-like beta-propeller repeat protein [Chloroflexi bacterium]|nr:PQQ-binding-like beta-propeller repeat protein [Chloroflexota bacterium]
MGGGLPRRRLGLLAGVLLGLVIASSAAVLAQTAAPNAWYTYGADAGRTGYNAGETSIRAPLYLTREYRVGTGTLTSPAVAAGLVLVVSSDGSVYALDAPTGRTRWSYATGGPVRGTPVYVPAQGPVGAETLPASVFFASEDGSVYSVEAATGALRWRRPVNAPIRLPLAYASGFVFVTPVPTPGALAFLALASTDGTFWHGRYAIGELPAPVVSDFDRLAYFEEPALTAYPSTLSAQAGEPRWRFSNSNIVPFPGSPTHPTAGPGIVFGVWYRGWLAALDSGGRLLWERPPPGEVNEDPAPLPVAYAGDQVIGTMSAATAGAPPYAFALSATLGIDRWATILEGSRSVLSQPAVANGLVFLVDCRSGSAGQADSRGLRVLDASSGQERWRSEAPLAAGCDRDNAAPAVAEGAVYLVTGVGRLIALTSSPPAPTPTPSPTVTPTLPNLPNRLYLPFVGKNAR